ncbi:MAG: TonB-dependent receptor, partial [Brevundimonas sp.]
MNRLVKTVLLAGAAWGALSASAVAQEASAEAQASSIDDVIVTARRREETLKDVPVSVSALGAERLEETGATDITALQQQTPNATVQVARGSNSTLISFIRGIGQQDPLWGFEPGVGLYVDDVYVARPQGAVLDIFDIQRIEVLRGPQGSLYGRNSVGGAIKYVTSRLDPDSPELTLRGAYGSYNQVDLLAQGSMPVTDKLRIGAAVASYNRDGYGENLNTGAEHYNKDVLAGRVSVEFQPYDNAFFRLAYDRVEDKSNPRHGHREVAGVGP